jgi:hypothetical protein
VLARGSVVNVFTNQHFVSLLSMQAIRALCKESVAQQSQPFRLLLVKGVLLEPYRVQYQIMVQYAVSKKRNKHTNVPLFNPR